LAKLFFTELSTKDNAVYNNLPDIISNLSSKESGVSEDAFKNIMKYLFSFIDKVFFFFFFLNKKKKKKNFIKKH